MKELSENATTYLNTIMEKYESSQKQILKGQEAAYERLCDLRNVQKFIPNENLIKEQAKIEDIEFGQDFISFKAPMAGKVTLKIIDRESPKMVKFGVEGAPVAANLWVQLVGVAEADTRMKLTVKAEIPFMLKPMVGGKVSEGLERLADILKFMLEAND